MNRKLFLLFLTTIITSFIAGYVMTLLEFPFIIILIVATILAVTASLIEGRIRRNFN
jgi:hypothetical protein